MIHYLRREKTGSITPQLVMAALERNFNGCEAFNDVCKEFLEHVSVIVTLIGRAPYQPRPVACSHELCLMQYVRM